MGPMSNSHSQVRRNVVAPLPALVERGRRPSPRSDVVQVNPRRPRRTARSLCRMSSGPAVPFLFVEFDKLLALGAAAQPVMIIFARSEPTLR